MNTLFDAYRNTASLLKSAQNQVSDVINEIVKKLQGEKGYVKFDEYTSYPHFEDYAIGTDSIIAARWDEEKKELQFITESQGISPEDISPKDEDWFYWMNYGNFDFDEFVSVLEQMAK